MANIPPQNIDAEKSLLGCMILGVDSFILPEHFYIEAHKLIAKHILRLVDLGINRDIVTIANSLMESAELDKIGGPSFLAELSDCVPSQTNSDRYAKIVRDKYDKREIIRAGTELISACYEDSSDIEDMKESLESAVFKIGTGGSKEFEQVGTYAKQAMQKMIDTNEHGSTYGLKTGFADLDNMLSGLVDQDLIIIAGRPSMGKTALVSNMLHDISVKRNIPAGFISLEMGGIPISNRLISEMTGINSYRFKSGKMTELEMEKVSKAVNALNNSSLYIDPTPALTITEIKSRARKLKLKHDIKVLAVDYMQMVVSSGRSREEEVRSISGALKALAKELNIPVVALSQLSRTLESRNDKRPQMSDLRDSGAIEQDADVIMFVYRDEVYNKDIDNPKRGIAEIIIGKQRDGMQGTVELIFDSATTTFKNMIRMHEANYG